MGKNMNYRDRNINDKKASSEHRKFATDHEATGRMRSRKKAGALSVFMALMIVMSGMSVAFADSTSMAEDRFDDTVNTRVGSYNVSGVHQSTSTTSVTTFGSAMPLSTIYIDMNAMNNPSSAVFTKLANSSNPLQASFADGIKEVNGIASYDPTGQALQLEAEKDNYLPGNLFSYTFMGAATLPDGTPANVRFTYSNAHIFVDQRLGSTGADEALNGAVNLAQGNNVKYRNNCSTNYGSYYSVVTGSTNNPTSISSQNSNTFYYPINGLSMDARVQIVDDAGNPIAGTFIFPAVGLNIDRDPTNPQNVSKMLWYFDDDYPEMDFFSEALRVNSGNVADIYVRPNTDQKETNAYGSTDLGYFNPRITEVVSGAYQGAVKVTADTVSGNVMSQASNGHYSSGFITTADSAAGFNVTATGHGGYNSGMDTYLIRGNSIWHRIRSVTGSGGTIQTTSEGNKGGTLDDKSDSGEDAAVLGQGTYVVPDGKAVTYTMTPMPGYTLDKLYVNDDLTSFPNEINGVADMADGTSRQITLSDGSQCTITKSGDGKGVYTFDFPFNKSDHTILVTWKPAQAEAKATKIWYDKNDAFSKRDDVTIHLIASVKNSDGSSYVYPVDYLPAYAIAEQSVADGNEAGSFTFGEAVPYTGTKGETVYAKVEDVPTTQNSAGKTLYYFYDFATHKFTAYTYNTTSGVYELDTEDTDGDGNGKTDYWVNFLPKYTATGEQIIYTIEEDVPDGYSLTTVTDDYGSLATYPGLTTAKFDYKLKNTLEPAGTVKVKVTKALDGRPFNATDEFIFVLSGKDGSPMPVESPAVLPADGEDTPKEVAKTINPPANTVLADADFGIIAYRKSDLTETKVTYGAPTSEQTSAGYKAANDEQKDAVRFWTVKNAPTEVDKRDSRGYAEYTDGSGTFYYDEANQKLYDSTGSEVTSFDINNYTKQTATVTADRVYDMLDADDTADFNALDANLKDSATASSYEEKFEYVATENPKHPDYVENDPETHNMTVRVFYNEKENKIYIDDEEATTTKKGVTDITAETTTELATPAYTLQRDFFTNTYDNKVSWEPEVTKILNGRPISNDQFKDYFTIKAVDTAETVNAQVTATLTAAETPMPNGSYGGTATSNSQEIEGASSAPKGTNDVKAIVGFDTITYTNDDLLKEINYNDATNEQKNRVIKWVNGSNIYGPIPGTATATVTKADGSTDTVTYDNATDAQRAEVKSRGDGWTGTDGTYYDITEAKPADLADSKGYYYLDSRKFTYKIWESGTAQDGYTNDPDHDSESEAYEVEVTVTRDNTTGKLSVTADKQVDELLFENKYKAEGDALIKVTKKMDGRDEFGRNTFPDGSKVKFTISKVTLDAPLPSDNEKSNEITVTLPAGQSDYTLTDDEAFNIKFETKHLMDANQENYVATRNKDGLYERTFVYKVTEIVTAGSGTTAESPTEGLQPGTDQKDSSDTRGFILVAVTVQEDNEGNIKVVAINGADKTALGNSDYSNQNIAIEDYVPASGKGTWDGDSGKMNPVVTSKVKAGTIYNTYQAAGNVEITAKKVLEGGNLKANQFYFNLIGKIRDKDNSVIDNFVLDTQANKADGTVKFEKLVYNLNDVRADVKAGIALKETKADKLDYYTYTYKVKEIIPDESVRSKGYTFDNNELEVKVTLKDDGKGKLTLADNGIVWTGGKDTIKNKYEAKGEAIIEGTKVLEGRELQNEEFSYTVTPKEAKEEDGTVISGLTPPRPVDGTNKNDANGAINFGTVKFTSEDHLKAMEDHDSDSSTPDVAVYKKKRTFTYEIEENVGSDKKITYDTTKRTVTVTVEDKGDGTLSVTPVYTTGSSTWTNKYEIIDIQAKKTWTGKAATDVEYKLQYREGSSGRWTDVPTTLVNPATHTFTKNEFGADGGTANYTFEGAPKYYDTTTTPKGEYQYQVLETTAATSFTADPSTRTAGSNESYTITNTPKKNSILVKKVWDDDSNRDGLRPKEPPKVYLYADNKLVSADPVPVPTDANNTNVPDGATYTWNNLPVYKDNTTKISYKVVEEHVAGYTTTYSTQDIKLNDDGTTVSEVTVTNKQTPAKSNLRVTKVWDDNDNSDGKRPETVSVTLKQNGADYAPDGQPATVQLQGTDTSKELWHTWTNLPENVNGDPAVYTVEEATVSGYTTVTTYKATSGILRKVTEVEIKNSYTPETTKIDAEKVWNDGNNKDGLRPNFVKFTLYKSVDGSTPTKVTPEQTLNITGSDSVNTWTGSIEGLAKYEDGKLVQYSFVEESADVPTGYTNDENTTPATVDTTAKTTITNTHEPASGTVTVTKTWSDYSNKYNLRPSADEFKNMIQLKDSDGNAASDVNGTTVVPTVTDNKNNTFTVTWNNVAVYKNGEKIVYSIEEARLPDAYSVSGNLPKNIKLTYDDDEEKWSASGAVTNTLTSLDIPVRKIWIDYDADKTSEETLKPKRPASVTLRVTASSVLSGMGWTTAAGGTTSYKDISLTATDKVDSTSITNGAVWEKVLEDLPTHDIDGNPISYSVDEPTVPGNYEKTTLPGIQNDDYAVVNVYKGATFTGTKQWSDSLNHNNSSELTPALKIQSTTTAPANWDGTETWSAPVAVNTYHIDWSTTTTADDTFTIIGLPAEDENGNKLYYRVTEDAPTGYKATYTNTGNYASFTDAIYDKGTVVNTMEKATINVTKAWDDDSNSAGMRQPTTVYLYKQVGTPVIDQQSGDVTRYTYSGGPTLVGEIEEGKISIADSNNVTVDWSDLPVVENGAPIRYTVKENAIKGYTTEIKYSGGSSDATYGTKTNEYLVLATVAADGTVTAADGTAAIKNKYEPGLRGLEITKVWDDADNPDGKRPETITATITAEFADGTSAKVFGSGLTATNTKDIVIGTSASGVDKKFTKVDDNTWKWEYVGDSTSADYSGFKLPAESNGREVIYYVSEKTTPTDYTSVVERTEAGKYEITNTRVIETVDRPVRVTWVDDTDMLDETTGTAGVTTERPTEITVTLQQKINGKWVDGSKKIDGTAVPSSITLDASKNLDNDPNNWGDTTTWTGLPKKDSDGNVIEYRVIQTGYKMPGDSDATTGGKAGADDAEIAEGSSKPVKLAGYSTVPINMPVSGVLTTIVNAFDTTTITGSKIWVDPDPDSHNNSSEIKFIVKRKAPSDSSWVTLTEGTDYHVDWTDDGAAKDKKFAIKGLTKYVDPDADPKVEYQYQVTEDISSLSSKYDTQYFKANGTTATDTLENDGVIKNIIKQEYVTVKVTKKWVGAATDDVTVKLKSDAASGDGIVATHEFKKRDFAATDTAEFTFKNIGADNAGQDKLPKYNLNPESDNYGKEIVYTVEETPDGTAADAKFSSEITGDAENGFVITNTNGEKITIYAKKVWDKDEEDKSKRAAVKFQLIQTRAADEASKNIQDPKDATETAATFEPITDPYTGDCVTWTVPKYDNGALATYDVKEVSVPDGYSMSKKGSGTKEDPYIITNTLIEDTTEIVVSKVWEDDNNQDGIRPSRITVNLLANEAQAKDDADAPITAELSAANNWKHTFKELPTRSNTGKIIAYSVEEAQTPDGYTPSVSGSESKGFVITNTHKPGVKTITATKVWNDPDYLTPEQKKELHTDVILHLYGYVDGEAVYYAGSKKVEMDADGTPKSSVTWSDVPERYYSDKNLKWKLVEDAVFGYVASIEGDAANGFTVTNTYAGAEAEIKVSKAWEDNNYSGRPAKITYILKQKILDGDQNPVSEYGRQTVDVGSTSEGKAEYTWKNLPVVKEIETDEDAPDTTRIEYEDKEQQLTNDAGWLAYKRLTDPVEAGDPAKDEIIYVNPDDKATYDADTINYEPVMEKVSVPVERTEDGGKVTKEVPVLYSVEEVYEDADDALNLEKLGYEEPVVEAVAPGEFKVTNIRRTEMVNFDVIKIWNDEDDAEGLRPEHITLRLMNGDEEVRKATLTEDDDWMHTFMNLPKTGADGAEIKYSIEEVSVPGYTSKVPDTLSSTEVNEIINTHNVGGLISLEATKKWVEEDGYKSQRSDVTFKLVKIYEDAEGGARQVVAGSEKTVATGSKHENNMTATWTGLPTIENGKKLFYTVVEDKVDGYEATYSDVTKKSGSGSVYTVTVTNTSTVKEEVEPPTPTPVPDTTGDVIYIDPRNSKGNMIVGSTKYDTYSLAEQAANAMANQPAEPEHSGVKFIGWDLNVDKNGNYVLVAMYSEIPDEVSPVVSYIDPQSGTPVLVSEFAGSPKDVIPPEDPSHENMQFVGWEETKDVAGNTIFVAKYKCDCRNGSPGTPKDVDKSKVDTGDDAMLTVWQLLFVMAISFLILTMMIRKRAMQAGNDSYKSKH